MGVTCVLEHPPAQYPGDPKCGNDYRPLKPVGESLRVEGFIAHRYLLVNSYSNSRYHDGISREAGLPRVTEHQLEHPHTHHRRHDDQWYRHEHEHPIDPIHNSGSFVRVGTNDPLPQIRTLTQQVIQIERFDIGIRLHRHNVRLGEEQQLTKQQPVLAIQRSDRKSVV